MTETGGWEISGQKPADLVYRLRERRVLTWGKGCTAANCASRRPGPGTKRLAYTRSPAYRAFPFVGVETGNRTLAPAFFNILCPCYNP